MLDCPHCGAVIPSDTAIDGVAQCAACSEVFELPPAVDVPERTAGSALDPVFVPSAPSGATIRSHEHGLEITLPWRADINAGGHLLQLFFVGVFVYAGLTSTGLAAAGGWALAVWMAYSWLYMTLNHTTVLIGRKGVEIAHGPLPSFSFGGSFSARELRSVQVEKVVKGFSYKSRRTVYELHAPLAAKRLLGDWNTRTSLDFVRDCIEAVVEPSQIQPGMVPEKRVAAVESLQASSQ